MGIAVKIVLPVAIAIAAIWGYLTYAHPDNGYQPEPQAMQQSQSPDSSAPAQDASQISARGTSNASLDADLNAVDADMQGASQSSASVDQSMNDKAGDTSY